MLSRSQKGSMSLRLSRSREFLGRGCYDCKTGEKIWKACPQTQRKIRLSFCSLLSASKDLSDPISRDTAILSLRYPISRDTFSGRLALPQNGAIPPPLVLNFIQTHLCDTPFCNVSRDNCAIPHKNKHERISRYYRYKYRAI